MWQVAGSCMPHQLADDLLQLLLHIHGGGCTSSTGTTAGTQVLLLLVVRLVGPQRQRSKGTLEAANHALQQLLLVLVVRCILWCTALEPIGHPLQQQVVVREVKGQVSIPPTAPCLHGVPSCLSCCCPTEPVGLCCCSSC
jgi:hypothetical protein